MPELPVEILRKVVYLVAWPPVPRPSLELEEWEDSDDMGLLLPIYHPLISSLDAHRGVREAMEALSRTSTALRSIALPYLHEVDRLELTPASFCGCDRRGASCSAPAAPTTSEGRASTRSLQLSTSGRDLPFFFPSALGLFAYHPAPPMVAELSRLARVEAAELQLEDPLYLPQTIAALVRASKLRQVMLHVGIRCRNTATALNGLKDCRIEVLVVARDGNTGNEDPSFHANVPTLLAALALFEPSPRYVRLEWVFCADPRPVLRTLLAHVHFKIPIVRLDLFHVHVDPRLLKSLIERCSSTLEYLRAWDKAFCTRPGTGPSTVFPELRRVRLGADLAMSCSVTGPSPRFLPDEWSCPSLRGLNVSNLHLETQDDVVAFTRRIRPLGQSLDFAQVDGWCHEAAGDTDDDDSVDGSLRSADWLAGLEEEMERQGCRTSFSFAPPPA